MAAATTSSIPRASDPPAPNPPTLRQTPSVRGSKLTSKANPTSSKGALDFADIVDDAVDECSSGRRRARHRIADDDLLTVRDTLASHNYQLRSHLGSGGFASVFQVWHIGYQRVFAVKIMDAPEIGVSLPEVTNLLPLLHPNIIKIYDTFDDGRFFYLVMEYCSYGNLKEKVRESGPLHYAQFRRIAQQLLSAIAYCHSMRIAHCDIKPPNVFFDSYGRPKLADFGLSRPFDEESSFGGSVPYMAPEVVNKVKGYDPAKADLWALGVTFFFCAAGRLPWKSSEPSGMAREIRQGAWSQPHNMDKRILYLIIQMLKPPPEQRPSIDHLLEILAEEGIPRLVISGPSTEARRNTLPSPPVRAARRWIDLKLKVGRPRKVLPSVFQAEIGALQQPDMSAWAASSDLNLAGGPPL